MAGNSSYTSTLHGAIPPVAPGNYYVIVVADSQGLVPDTDRAHDESASASPILISVPTLATNGSVQGTIAAGQSLLYQLSLPAEQNVVISASTSVAGVLDLYEQYQTTPTPATFDHEDVNAGFRPPGSSSRIRKRARTLSS